MEFPREDEWQQGLRAYVRLVAEALAVTAEAYNVQTRPPADAYIALHRRSASFPDRDAALIWEENHGWALTVEAKCGEDLIVTGYLGHDIVPPPPAVARFVRRCCDGLELGVVEPPTSRGRQREDVLRRFAAYAELMPSSLPATRLPAM
jgi:hypothetical protein